jgi:hypothetical protein
MTVRQLADTLGLHDGEIEKIEKGRAPKRVLSALAPPSIAGRMKVEIFQAACNTLITVAVRRRKWNLR